MRQLLCKTIVGFMKMESFCWRNKIGYNPDGTIFSKNGRFA
jgi:hypothetical protein